jgi:hypothetical protein
VENQVAVESKLTTPFDVISLACDNCGISMSFDTHTLRKTLGKDDRIIGRCLFCHKIMVINRKRFEEIEEEL